MTKPRPLKPGDLVELRSGSATMTVNGRALLSPDEAVETVWFSAGRDCRGTFAEAALIRVAKARPAPAKPAGDG